MFDNDGPYGIPPEQVVGTTFVAKFALAPNGGPAFTIYDRQSHIGKLDHALDEATEKQWVVVDMKSDWRVICPFQR